MSRLGSLNPESPTLLFYENEHDRHVFIIPPLKTPVTAKAVSGSVEVGLGTGNESFQLEAPGEVTLLSRHYYFRAHSRGKLAVDNAVRAEIETAQAA